jgi:hypothetical protein
MDSNVIDLVTGVIGFLSALAIIRGCASGYYQNSLLDLD